MPTSILIFAHYHRKGLIREDTVALLQEAQKYFCAIIFISTYLLDEEIQKIADIVHVVRRENIGYDFFSYREGLVLAEKNKIFPDFYFLVNSSFICTDPQKMWRQVHAQSFEKNSLYGITRSFEVAEHIQSYFLIFSRDIFTNHSVYDWWVNMSPISERIDVVLNYEIGFSKVISKCGFGLKPIFEHQNYDLSPTIGIDENYRILFRSYIDKNFNPTFYHWMDLEELMGIIKIEMLKSNPCNMNLASILNRAANSIVFQRQILQALEN